MKYRNERYTANGFDVTIEPFMACDANGTPVQMFKFIWHAMPSYQPEYKLRTTGTSRREVLKYIRKTLGIKKV